MAVVQEGQLKGAFRGFKNKQTTFEFHGGGIWQQNEYKYHYHYAYMPQAKVLDDGGRHILYVDGISEPVEVKRIR